MAGPPSRRPGRACEQPALAGRLPSSAARQLKADALVSLQASSSEGQRPPQHGGKFRRDARKSPVPRGKPSPSPGFPQKAARSELGRFPSIFDSFLIYS